MAETAVTAPPSPEDRQKAIKILAQQMAQAPGVSQEDAESTAAVLIDSAIKIRQGSGEEAGEVGSDTEPD
jgi:hypothetical protein